MFTGIIEELGRVGSMEKHAAGARLEIACRAVLEDSSVGSSIAVNGVCLTAVELREDGFSADLAPETLERSSLGDLTVGMPVNLERPMALGARLSGHIVQGHVDGTGTLESLRELGDGNWELLVRVPQEMEQYLVYKGSICIDGISLTVASVEGNLVRVAIIPHTYSATNLASLASGARVNLEADVLAKHVKKLMEHMSLK